VKIEQYGPVVCSVPANSSFVCIDLSLQAVGEGQRGEAEYRYRIGAFVGRSVSWSVEQQPELAIRLRIPREKFRANEDLLLEVLDKRSHAVLWTRGWRAAWQGDLPVVESGDEGESSRGEWNVRPRCYRTSED
jgi:hypothetical protein